MRSVDYFDLEARAGEPLAGIAEVVVDNPFYEKQLAEHHGAVDVKQFKWSICEDTDDSEMAIAYRELGGLYVHIEKPHSQQEAKDNLLSSQDYQSIF